MRGGAILALLPLLAACSAPAGRDDAAAVPVRDPLEAALSNGPLMSDPDLAAANEANAILGFAGRSGVPVIPATPAARRAAREAGRLELLAAGAIPPLPAPAPGTTPAPPPHAGAPELLEALRAPPHCLAALDEGFGWAAGLPAPAAIMPHGMVRQAAGADAPRCRLRIVRYATPAAIADVLEYHHARALRAGLRPRRHAEASDSIAAHMPSGEALVVAARASASGLTMVDLLYRAPN